MAEELTQHDDIQFDRLVDGELSSTERRALLESLDQRPGGWRRCALAFLEAQSWGQEFRQLAGPSERALHSVEVVPSAQIARNPNGRRVAMWAGARWLALAASLLLAFTLGTMRRDRAVPIAVGPPQTNGQIATLTQPPAGAGRQSKVDDALTFWVRDDKGQARPLRVPLVDARTLDDQLGMQFQPGIPADVRDRLQNGGFNVQSQRRYAPLWLENGRPMILPVEDTRIVPVSNKAL
jgi:hypothetical protein